MTIEALVYDIFEIRSLLEDDHDIDELWCLNKINMYRSLFIVQEYNATQEIRPSWMQRLRKQKTLKVDAADDPSITYSSIHLSKVTLPSLVGLPGDMGLVRVSGSSAILSYDIIDFDTLMLKISSGEERTGQFGYCSRIGNDLYMFPLIPEMSALILANNPMDVQVMHTDGTLRDMLVTDEYPIDLDMAQKIVLEILTKDLQINAQSVTDIVNDSQNQLKILKNAGVKEQTAN